MNPPIYENEFLPSFPSPEKIWEAFYTPNPSESQTDDVAKNAFDQLSPAVQYSNAETYLKKAFQKVHFDHETFYRLIEPLNAQQLKVLDEKASALFRKSKQESKSELTLLEGRRKDHQLALQKRSTRAKYGGGLAVMGLWGLQVGAFSQPPLVTISIMTLELIGVIATGALYAFTPWWRYNASMKKNDRQLHLVCKKVNDIHELIHNVREKKIQQAACFPTGTNRAIDAPFTEDPAPTLKLPETSSATSPVQIAKAERPALTSSASDTQFKQRYQDLETALQEKNTEIQSLKKALEKKDETICKMYKNHEQQIQKMTSFLTTMGFQQENSSLAVPNTSTGGATS